MSPSLLRALGFDGSSLTGSPLPPGRCFSARPGLKVLSWSMASKTFHKAAPAPSRFTQFPAAQGSPDAKPKTWLNQRELGRVFGLNGAQMGQALAQAGWRTADGSPSPDCLADGRAKSVPRTTYYRVNDGPSQQVIDHRWHAQKAVAGLEAVTGLKALSAQDVFARALADHVVTGIKPLARAAAQAKKEGQRYDWPDQLEKATWLSERLKNNLDKVAFEQLPDFLNTLRTLLVDRGVKPAPLEALLQVAGHLHGLRAHDLNAALAEPEEPRPRMRSRL